MAWVKLTIVSRSSGPGFVRQPPRKAPASTRASSGRGCLSKARLGSRTIASLGPVDPSTESYCSQVASASAPSPLRAQGHRGRIPREGGANANSIAANANRGSGRAAAVGRHYSLLGKRPTSMPLDAGAARPDPDSPRTAAFQRSSSERRRIVVVHLTSQVSDRARYCSPRQCSRDLLVAWGRGECEPSRQRAPAREGAETRRHCPWPTRLRRRRSRQRPNCASTRFARPIAASTPRSSPRARSTPRRSPPACAKRCAPPASPTRDHRPRGRSDRAPSRDRQDQAVHPADRLIANRPNVPAARELSTLGGGRS